MEASQEAERIRLYELGLVINVAVSEPAQLKGLLAPPVAAVEPTGMIKIPRKKKTSHG